MVSLQLIMLYAPNGVFTEVYQTQRLNMTLPLVTYPSSQARFGEKLAKALLHQAHPSKLWQVQVCTASLSPISAISKYHCLCVNLRRSRQQLAIPEKNTGRLVQGSAAIKFTSSLVEWIGGMSSDLHFGISGIKKKHVLKKLVHEWLKFLGINRNRRHTLKGPGRPLNK